MQCFAKTLSPSTSYDLISLGSNCLICGKGLTDPVSQARRIGPECAGTSSEQLPFVLDFAEQAASAAAP
jgi:hypothetical protein